MFLLLLVFSCFKDFNLKEKGIPVEAFDTTEKIDNIQIASSISKELGIYDTLSSLSKLLLKSDFLESLTEIQKAILNDDLELFERLFNESGKIFTISLEGMNYLHLIALVNPKKVFGFILKVTEVPEFKELVDQKDNSGRTFLHLALLTRNFDLCTSALLKVGKANGAPLLLEKDNNGLSCFHYLAFSDFFENYKKKKTTNTFLDKINFCKINFCDATAITSFYGDFKIFHQKDNKGLTSLHYAAYFGDLNLFKEFFKSVTGRESLEGNDLGFGALTPLHIAYLSEQGNIIKYILSLEENKDFGLKQENVLGCLLQTANLDLIRPFLLKAKSEVEKEEMVPKNLFEEQDGEFVIHKLIIDACNTLKSKEPFKAVASAHAVELPSSDKNKEAKVDTKKARGVMVAPDESEKQVTVQASNKEKVESVIYMLEQAKEQGYCDSLISEEKEGTDVDTKQARGVMVAPNELEERMRVKALNKKKMESVIYMLELIKERGCFDTLVSEEKKESEVDTKKARGVMVAPDKSEEQVTVQTLNKEKMETVIYMLALAKESTCFNTLVSEKNKEGKSCFHLSVGYPVLLKILYASSKISSEISEINKNEKVPLHFAVKYSVLESMKVIKDFAPEEVNAIATIDNIEKRTPLDIAVEATNLEAVKVLLDFKKISEETKAKSLGLALLIIRNSNEADLNFDTKVEIALEIFKVVNLDSIMKNGDTVLINVIKEIGKNLSDNFNSFRLYLKDVLINKKYDLLKQDSEGNNILHLLILNNMDEELLLILKKLIFNKRKSKVDRLLDIKNRAGKKILDLAFEKNNSKILSKILECYTKKRRNIGLGLESLKTKESLLVRALKEKKFKVTQILLEILDDFRESRKKGLSEELELERNFVRNLSDVYDLTILFSKEQFYFLSEIEEETVIKSFLEDSFKVNKGLKNIEINKGKIAKIIELAAYVGDFEVFKYLMKEIDALIDKPLKDLNKLLFEIKEGKYIKLLETLLYNDEDINLLGEYEENPLFIASKKGHKEVVELLLTKGAKVDSVDKDERTLLWMASQLGKREVVELLLAKGAKVDLADKDGKTQLYIASQEGHKEVVELLLAKGAKVDLADKDGKTQLYIASQEGHKEVVELLLAKGAKVDLADKDGKTQLYTASQEGHKEVVELLLAKGADIDLASKDGRTPIYIASQEGHKEVVELLLKKGAEVNLFEKDGKTPLYGASYNRHKEVVELLLAKGAKVDLADKDGKTQLYIASQEGHKEVVELLLTKGASVDLANKDGVTTPLLIASYNGHKEVVELLLAKGADIDLASKDGVTPLLIASYIGRKEIVELLLAEGADIDLICKVGSKSWWPTFNNECEGVVESLLSKVATGGGTPLYKASQEGHKEIVELLLKKGSKVNLSNRYGETPLYIASCFGHKEVVELLLAKGANVNLSDNAAITPLSIARQKGRKKIVEILEKAMKK